MQKICFSSEEILAIADCQSEFWRLLNDKKAIFNYNFVRKFNYFMFIEWRV